eukprot:TRINITY_DN4575_c0_g1_i16.p1 TRINITY_DN4575_c0_g1~~TRINITY_DN4575_c0_g1_i16.p1  ORF type:complete len:449 (+),score=59.59 TRINITY_DN4575_c0_g1_i16:242-1588(+)
MALFTIPLDKAKNASSVNVGWSQCWETIIPGLPTLGAFSNNHKQFAVVFKVVTEEGIRQRIRYYPSIDCEYKLPYNDSVAYFEERKEKFSYHFADSSKYHEDMTVLLNSEISAISVAKDIVAYSTYYETRKFHLMNAYKKFYDTEKSFKKVMYSPAERQYLTLYESCYKLHILVRNYSILLMNFMKMGESRDRLEKTFTLHNIKNFINEYNPSEISLPDSDTREPLHKLIKMQLNHRIDSTSSASYIVQDFESPMKPDFGFKLLDNETLKFALEDEDGIIVGEQPFESIFSSPFNIFQKWPNAKHMAVTEDSSLMVFLAEETSNLVFYDTRAQWTKHLQLAELPRNVRQRKILNLLALSPKEHQITLLVLFRGGALLELNFEKEEVLKIGNTPSSTISLFYRSYAAGVVALIVIVWIVGTRIVGWIIKRDQDGEDEQANEEAGRVACG